MPRPKKLKVGPHWYTISYTKKDWNDFIKTHADVVDEIDSVSGFCWPEAGIIMIKSSELSFTQERECLVHELLHACLGTIGFGCLSATVPGSKVDLEEDVVLLLSPMLYSVIVENPGLIEYLSEVEK